MEDSKSNNISKNFILSSYSLMVSIVRRGRRRRKNCDPFSAAALLYSEAKRRKKKLPKNKTPAGD